MGANKQSRDTVSCSSFQRHYPKVCLCCPSQVYDNAIENSAPTLIMQDMDGFLWSKCFPGPFVVIDSGAAPIQADFAQASEVRTGKSWCSPLEGAIIVSLLGQVPGDSLAEVAVITPYAGHREYLESLHGMRPFLQRGLELHTIDSCQGREKDTILLSMVRSSTDARLSAFLSDRRRLNVALTRARKGLLLIINCECYARDVASWKVLLDRASQEGKIFTRTR